MTVTGFVFCFSPVALYDWNLILLFDCKSVLPWTSPCPTVCDCQREASKISYVNESFNFASLWEANFSLLYSRTCANEIPAGPIFIVSICGQLVGWAQLSSPDELSFLGDLYIDNSKCTVLPSGPTFNVLSSLRRENVLLSPCRPKLDVLSSFRGPDSDVLPSPCGPNSMFCGSVSNVLCPSLWTNFNLCPSLWTKYECFLLPFGPISDILSSLVDQI